MLSMWAFISAVKGVTSITLVADSALSATVTDDTALVTGMCTASATLASRPGLNKSHEAAGDDESLDFVSTARSRRRGQRSRRVLPSRS